MGQFRKVSYVDGGEYVYEDVCRLTRKPYATAKVKGSDLYRYNQGDHVQVAFPYLSADDREFILSGTSSAGWDILFPEPEAEPTDEYPRNRPWTWTPSTPQVRCNATCHCPAAQSRGAGVGP